MIQFSPFVVYPIAGHNNSDPGAVYNSQKEADKTKEFRDLVSKNLSAKGHKHIKDSDDENNRQLQNRIKPGSGSVLIDHHFNASSNLNATGTEVIVSNNANANSKALAKELAEGTACILGIANRGVKTEAQTARGRIGILNLNAGIACLIEIAFLSNPNDMVKYELKKDELARFYADTYIKYDNLI